MSKDRCWFAGGRSVCLLKLPVLSPVVPPGLYVSTEQSLGPAQADDDRSHVNSRGLKGIAFHAALPLSINAKKFVVGSLPRCTKGAGLGTVPWAVLVSLVWSTEVMDVLSDCPMGPRVPPT